MKQDNIFYDKEGNNWFARNGKYLKRSPMEHVSELLDLYPISPKRILDIGSSNGWLLSRLVERYKALGLGIEPSKAAVKDGNARYKNIKLKRGLACNIPVDGTFDLVVANFVLHWVSREQLLRSLSEIDRVLEEGGHVLIVDFMPDVPTKTRYHHLPDEEVFTYKLDYPKLFCATGSYRTVARLTFDHKKSGYSTNVLGSERCEVALLEKSKEGYYQT